MTVSGKAIDSNKIGSCALQSVSPVTEWRSPTMPMMSPAETALDLAAVVGLNPPQLRHVLLLVLAGIQTRLFAFNLPE